MTCKKCGATAPYVNNLPPITCPACGAVYAKVVDNPARMDSKGPASRRPQSSGFSQTVNGSTRVQGESTFITELRANTHYPAFRAVARLSAMVIYLVAAVVLIGGLARANLAWAIGGAAVCILLCVLGRLTKEVSMMFADLSDAAVYTASHQSDQK